MTDWTSGYVADIGYTHGFYRELTPAMLRLVTLAKGQAGPDVSEAITYCELGCGQGYSANLLAAANPHIEFHATDFNPTHVAGAMTLMREGGSSNIRFYEDSFAEFLERPELPQFDVISLHGIYSWIAAEHRRTIVEFVRRKLKPGGIVYISYNSLPGWSAAAPLRHLMYLHGKSHGGPTAGRLDSALHFVGRVVAADARFFAASPALKTRYEQIAKQNRNYLAHEYLNDVWTLLYHSDVAAELGAAKLHFLASAHLIEQIEAINMTPPQKQIIDEMTDPVLRETLRDYMVNQQFRRDVFGKGVTPFTPLQAREAWMQQRFALSVARSAATLKVTGALGEADLNEPVYGPLLDVLADGPATVQQLISDPRLATMNLPRLQEALVILCGSGQAQPCLPSRNEGARAKSTKAFNRAVVRRARDSGELSYLASPVTGGGITVGRFQQLFLLAAEEGHKTPEAWASYAWAILSAQGQLIIKNDKTLQSPEENIAELNEQANAFAKDQLPVLKALLVA